MSTSEKAEHTPGPWKAMHPDSGLICHATDDVFIAQALSERNINEIDPVPLNEHAVANQNLIARAPDLLAENQRLRDALEEAKAELEWCSGSGDFGEAGHKLLDILTAADDLASAILNRPSYEWSVIHERAERYRRVRGT